MLRTIRLRHSRLAICSVFVLFVSLTTLAGQPNPHEQPQMVTLLIQGAAPVISSTGAEEAWGRLGFNDDDSFRWTGFIGHFRGRGYRFGGIIRSSTEKQTRQQIDRLGADLSIEADYYLLASSVHAQQLGVESRAREIAAAVELLRSIHPQRKVCLVCHSAGGIAARLWIQGGLPNVPFPTESVGHVITIGTPHLGLSGLLSVAAQIRKEYRVLNPDSSLLTKLNKNLELPDNVAFTSIVLQGLSGGLADDGKELREHIDATGAEIRALPLLMSDGHDGIVHSLSAQLHLTATGGRYENRTNRPIRAIFCVMPIDHLDNPAYPSVHTAAMRRPELWKALADCIVERDQYDQEGKNEQIAQSRAVITHAAQQYTVAKYGFASARNLQFDPNKFDRPLPDRLRCHWQAVTNSTSGWLTKRSVIHVRISGSVELHFGPLQRIVLQKDGTIKVQDTKN